MQQDLVRGRALRRFDCVLGQCLRRWGC
jgi:hypothetical protein